MEIEVLGAHMTEIAAAKPTALLVDGVLALDAGSLCSSLSFPAQQKLKAILITHCHYDHVRDIPTIAMNIYRQGSLEVYLNSHTYEVLSTHLLDGQMYPNFLEQPPDNPALRFVTLEPYRPVDIGGYTVLAVPVPHSVPTVGYQLSAQGSKSLFYTGDTGGGLSACWEHVSPDLLITEVSMPRRMERLARETMHLTPGSLREELLRFRHMKGYVPATVLIHVNPFLADEIETEVTELAEELGASITLGHEGTKLYL